MHRKLDNLVAIVDYNKLQSMESKEKTLNIEPFVEKWKTFGWNVSEINGHNVNEIKETMKGLDFSLITKPKMVIANTIKGKGVKDMENNYGAWHSKVPNDEELNKINKDLDNYE